ncbi:MAG: F0F1 ATP synthase subunit C [Sphingomonadaceae bacterium]|jgi:F-type H+-transporting ATPase subunit c|nr:F0F1 ATP synthase subunit C [Sphingomonadaceae bacterium]
MDAAAAKLLGAGIATFGMGLAALGVGVIFGLFLQGALRNPAAANSQRPNLLFGFAVTEALGIFSFLVALILLFVV